MLHNLKMKLAKPKPGAREEARIKAFDEKASELAEKLFVLGLSSLRPYAS